MALFVLLAIVAYADYLTGDRISLSVFYLPLVSFACWIGGLRYGIWFALLSSVAWLADDFVVPDVPPPDFYKYWQTGVRFVTFAAFAFVVERLHEALQREASLARHDHLTGLFNSQGFFELAQRELLRARRTERPLSIIYFDCDNFKQINDTLGHAMGDQLLKATAHSAEMACRRSDILARLGGDEFAILLPETGERAKLVARHVQQAARSAMQEHAWPVTFSMGVATFHAPTTTEQLVRAADRLMYRAKKSGKNRLVFQSFDSPAATDTMHEPVFEATLDEDAHSEPVACRP